MSFPTREEMVKARLVKVVLAYLTAAGPGFRSAAEVRAGLVAVASKLKVWTTVGGNPGPVFARCAAEIASAGFRVTPARTRAARGFQIDLEGK